MFVLKKRDVVMKMDSDIERRFVFHGKTLPDKDCLTGIIGEEGFVPRPPSPLSGKIVRVSSVIFVHEDMSRIEYTRTQTQNFGTDKYIASGNAETVDSVMARIEQAYARASKHSTV